ncbi:extracellular solute-binding protein [Frigidibacter sp. SD6-1]|uniref:ABC transporter substrate-binding protein n=1 Tax=Frigidibacter sp. SD6-1 TaxID=3032581 RepID=UPI0024DF5C73|nr:extracellular solute-binding protein [Frigidibacter sp. SD6-1]
MIKRTLLAATAIVSLTLPVMAADAELTVMDWAGYEIEGFYADYTAKHNNSPTYSLFASDDEAFQRAVSGFKADVVHPCSTFVDKYREAGLIEPWDESKLTSVAQLDPNFLASPSIKDDQGLWFLPFDWGATAVAYNTNEVPAEDIASLNIFIDPKYQGRTSLPNSSEDVWALAYLATGTTSWVSISDEQFDAAAEWLRKAHQNVRAYWNDSAELSQLMASGEVLVGWAWNDAVALLQDEGFPVGYQREAAEGSSTWFCGYVNMKNAPGNEDKAYDFVNSLLRADAAGVIVDELGVGHSNATGMGVIPAETLATAGLGAANAPILAQVPKDPALHEKMLQTFENIKAGF